MNPKELKCKREKLGMTQQQLAEALGVVQARISEWERGIHKPPPYLSLALKALEMEAGEIKRSKDNDR